MGIFAKNVSRFLLIVLLCSYQSLMAQSAWVGEAIQLSCPKPSLPFGWDDYYTSSISWSIPNSSDRDKVTLSRVMTPTTTVTPNYYFEGKVRVQVVHHVVASKIIGKVESHKPMDFTSNFYITCKKTGVSIFPEELSVTLGCKGYIEYSFEYPDANPAPFVTFKSSNPDIASVSNGGTVLAKKEGTVTIVATTNYNTTATCIVHVKPVEVTAVVFPVASLNVYTNQTLGLYPEVYPDNATHKELQWSSSNDEVATVDAKGIVYAHNPGLAEIKALSKSGAFGCCYINVLPAVNEVVDVIGDSDAVELIGTDLLIKGGKYILYDMCGHLTKQGEGAACIPLQPRSVYILQKDGRMIKIKTK